MAIINLYGASGHGKVVADLIKSQGDKIGIIYDDVNKPPLHNMKILKPCKNNLIGPLIISIGDNNIRKSIANKLNVEYATAIHSSAIISPYCIIEEGTVVMQGAIIQSDAKIGRHCIINSGASIDHECQIADFVHVSPHATLCGNVIVGECSWIGANATIIQGIKIGKYSVIGAGSVVTRDLPDFCVAYGNPCKIRRIQ